MACVSAVCATASAFTPGFSFWIARPRVSVGAAVVLSVLPPVTTGLPIRSIPVIVAFRSANGMRRWFDTLIAATNCPKFLKPAVALFRSVPAGSELLTFLKIFGLVDTFSATAFVGPHAVGVVVDVVPLEPVLVEPEVLLAVVLEVVFDFPSGMVVEAVVPAVVAVCVMPPLFIVALVELAFGVVNLADFLVAGTGLEVLVVLDPADPPLVFTVEDLTTVAFGDFTAFADPAAVVLGPCALA